RCGRSRSSCVMYWTTTMSASVSSPATSQVNTDINRQMIDRAIAMLELTPEDRVLDLFCGLGNFTLPLARRCREVVGVEGEAKLVERARANATENQLGNVQFHAADLAGDLEHSPWWKQGFDKVLLDP